MWGEEGFGESQSRNENKKLQIRNKNSTQTFHFTFLFNNYARTRKVYTQPSRSLATICHSVCTTRMLYLPIRIQYILTRAPWERLRKQIELSLWVYNVSFLKNIYQLRTQNHFLHKQFYCENNLVTSSKNQFSGIFSLSFPT